MKLSNPLPLFLVLLGAPPAAQSTVFDVPATGFANLCDLVGDLDGDGHAEFVFGFSTQANGSITGAGCVYVHSGADAHVLYTLRGTAQGGHYGSASSAAGDVNADGFADLVVGAPDENVAGIGRDVGTAQVVSGRDGSVLYSFRGTRATEFFGTACARVGDLDADGHDDVAISATSATGPGGILGGAVRVFSGADGHLLREMFGRRNGYRLGSSLSSAGDVDADGTPDVVAGEVDGVRVFSGRDGHQLWSRTYPNQGPLLVSGPLDANGDGYPDFLVADYMVGTFKGRVEVISGRDNTTLFEVFGDAQGDQLGYSLTATGDLDGDGTGDFATGILTTSGPAGLGTGAVRAFSGRTHQAIFTIHGDAALDQLGRFVGSRGDVNGDGYPDVVTVAGFHPQGKVLSFVPRGLEPFGPGSSGCTGELRLLANGVPALGSAGFAFHLSGAGDVVTSLLAGDALDVAGTLRYGARFHLDPLPLPPARGILTRTQLPLPDPRGSIVAPLPIPPDPALLGLTLGFQGISFFRDGLCARRIASTPGLRFTFQ